MLDDERIRVVATTPILTDVVENIAGDKANVTGLIPRGKDPHEYELGLRAVREIAYADAAFTNGLLLEPRSLAHTVDATVPEGTRVVEVAEQAQRYGFQPLMLVEDAGLDQVWLGMKVAQAPEATPRPKTTVADLVLTDVRGPGQVAAYIVGTFGTPELLFNSGDGVSKTDGTTLPMDAHTHVSWAFSKPGVYRLTFAAAERAAVGAPAREIGEQTFTVAVGVDPATVGQATDILDHGHVDITTELGSENHERTPGRILLRGDAPVADPSRNVTESTRHDFDPSTTVIAVGNQALQEVPSSRDYRFLGEPGDEVYLLPQAVLGKHVHGERDPHFWHDAAAMEAVANVVRDELSAVDPANAPTYNANADRYIEQLRRVDATMRAAIDSLPPENRNLVTTHDGYGYLGAAYGLSIAGFLSPNPSVEPSPRDMLALTRTLENLRVPAVFLEPQAQGKVTELTELASRLGVRVCTIWGDSLDPPGAGPVTSYIEMMRANARSLSECLGGHNAPLR